LRVAYIRRGKISYLGKEKFSNGKTFYGESKMCPPCMNRMVCQLMA